ncbi:MAG TPA: hypothetical protein VGJ60_25540 [Chloroflexota bacterium]
MRISPCNSVIQQPSGSVAQQRHAPAMDSSRQPGVARSQLVEDRCQLGSLVDGAAGDVGEDPIAAGAQV